MLFLLESQMFASLQIYYIVTILIVLADSESGSSSEGELDIKVANSVKDMKVFQDPL